MSSPLLFLGYTYIQNRRPCIQVIGLAIYLFWLFPCIFVTQEIFDLLVRRATLLSCHYKKHFFFKFKCFHYIKCSFFYQRIFCKTRINNCIHIDFRKYVFITVNIGHVKPLGFKWFLVSY